MENLELKNNNLKDEQEKYYNNYYNMIISYLIGKGIRKQDFAKEVGVSNTACSLFLQKLKKGKAVSTKTLNKYIKSIVYGEKNE